MDQDRSIFEAAIQNTGKGAIISPSGLYRYALWRIWQPRFGLCMFIGLNPSRADGVRDDPTMQREIGFAGRLGYGGVIKGNLFNYRTPDPQEMKCAIDPIGPEGDEWLQFMARHAKIIIAAWGTHGRYMDRDRQLYEMFGDRLYYLGLTLGGQPTHTLARGRHRLPDDAQPLRLIDIVKPQEGAAQV